MQELGFDPNRVTFDPACLLACLLAFCLAVLGLGCCMQSFSSCCEWGLLVAVASLVADHKLCGVRALGVGAYRLNRWGLRAPECGLSS